MSKHDQAEPAKNEPERPSAEIIAFPGRKPARPARAQQPTWPKIAPSTADQERLNRALAALNAAMADQRAAVAAWRNVLGELKTTTNNLSASLQGYRASLRTLSGSVTALKQKANALEAWADSVIAEQGPG